VYRTCIFCSGDLGTNESLEHFPVGVRVAYDGWRARLWAVCPKCGRWNLAPIEERWEAVEEAEKLFVDSRLRVQTENIGMAKLRDGSRLIRIGKAVPGELAAWRYGARLVERRRKHLLITSGAIAGGAAALALGVPFMLAGAGLGGIGPFLNLFTVVAQRRADARVVLRVRGVASSEDLIIRQRHLKHAGLYYRNGDLEIAVPTPNPDAAQWFEYGKVENPEKAPLLRLTGPQANALAARAMVRYNASGGSLKHLDRAVHLLQEAGSADAYMRNLTSDGIPLVRNRANSGRPDVPTYVSGVYTKAFSSFTENMNAPYALAFEMALHEESERRAMEGELAELEDAWREAEEIARIADALPGEPPE
jgi:hypothetical protein